MEISKYFKNSIKDFFVAGGCLMTIATIVSGIYSTEVIEISLLWQIILVSSAYAFLKLAFVNKDEISKKVQMTFFYVSLAISEILVLLWLWFFSPGKIMNNDLIIIYAVIILIVEGFVYAVMHINGKKDAKLINKKLIEHRNCDKI